MAETLFDEPTRRRLQTLMLHAARVRAGAAKGERRSAKRGVSIEFADTRDYTPGDDLRRLDWNIYARLDRPLIKLFEDEEDLAVHILIDTSASMDTGEGDANKFDYARRLTAALAMIALSGDDRLHIAALGGATFGPARGRSYLNRMFDTMTAMTAGGAVDLDGALRDYAAKLRRAGLCVIVSDLFSGSGGLIADGLRALAARGCEIVVLHTLAPDEIDPPLAGDLRLIDVETGAAQEVSIDDGMRAIYARRLETWRADLLAECRRRGAAYLPVNTAAPWERVILDDLLRLGVVR